MEDGRWVCSLAAADPSKSHEECRWAFYQQAFPTRAVDGAVMPSPLQDAGPGAGRMDLRAPHGGGRLQQASPSALH
eukprot:4238166-Alexandrium_andersonii.AAC.1